MRLKYQTKMTPCADLIPVFKAILFGTFKRTIYDDPREK